MNLRPHRRAPTARVLLRAVVPVLPTTTLNEVFDLFTADPQRLAVAVVDGDAAVGLVNRKALVERFARPYARELFGRKPISAFMESAPLVVELDTDLDELSRLIVEGDMQPMYDGFILTDNGRYAGLGAGHDLMRVLTERKQEHLYELAHYDALTGLPNRLLLQDRLRQALAKARRDDRALALLFIDIDRFKFVNDTLGHAAGDELIRQVGQRLEAAVRESDTVARVGGDEFIVLACGIDNAQKADAVAQKLLGAFAPACMLDGHELVVSASIGIALFPADDDGGEAGELFKKADVALHKAKELGKGQYQFYSAEMNQASVERLKLENNLRRALDARELTLAFQPRIDLKTRRVTSVEALLRWKSRALGSVSPAQFIPVAEETGLIVPIGEWVLREACRQAKAWQAAGLPPLRVAVNLSARQFQRFDLIKTIEHVLADTGLAPHYLELELTESLAMQNARQTVATLSVLAAMGISIAIDDFGTGYSSLAYLKRFPVDSLKIDQSFIREIASGGDDAAITKAIIAMAHEIKLRVVAEGVETEAQQRFLERHHCDEMQGFLFSRPLPADELATLLAHRHAETA